MEFLKFLCIYEKKEQVEGAQLGGNNIGDTMKTCQLIKVIAFITEVKYFMYEETLCKRKDTELHYSDFYC